MKTVRAIRLGLCAILLVPAVALAEAGRVLLAVGEVFAERAGQRVALSRGAAVEQGDTIRTGPASNAQIRLSDGAILSMSERTQLRIDEHVFSGRIDGTEKSFVTLLAGGLRTVTGAIGNLRRDDKYGVRTATAWIGIRGTHYTLRECNELSPCAVAGGRAALELAQAPAEASDAPSLLAQAAPGGQFAPPGTYGGVSDGRIGVKNEAGESEFGARQFFYVADRFTPPQGLVAPPPFLYDRLPGQTRTAGQTGTETGETIAQGGFQSDARAGEPPAPPRQTEFVATEQRGAGGEPAVVPPVVSQPQPVIGAVGALFSGIGDPGTGGGFSGNYTLSGTGFSSKLLDFLILPGEQAEPGGGTRLSAGAVISESDVVNETTPNSIGAIWGRWLSGGIADVEDGVTLVDTISPTNQFHYLGGPPTPPEVIAAKTGTFAMTDIGGTTPTNNLGETGSFSLSSAHVNFTTKVFSAGSSSFWFPSQSWYFSGTTAPIQTLPGKGAFVEGSASGSCYGSCSGPASLSMTGVFLGPQGDHLGMAFQAHTTGGAHAATARLLKCSPSC
ncbi:MAG: FecR family protein [Burkholderiales bacterium]|nr:FecR family protein [Burkholderiales bacterium]